jgi:hypothetical protein
MISSKTVVTDSIAKARSFKKQYNSSKDSYNPKEQANLGQMSKQPIGTAETTAAKSGTPKDDFKHRLADVRGDLADVRGDDQCPSGKTGVKIKR